MRSQCAIPATQSLLASAKASPSLRPSNRRKTGARRGEPDHDRSSVAGLVRLPAQVNLPQALHQTLRPSSATLCVDPDSVGMNNAPAHDQRESVLTRGPQRQQTVLRFPTRFRVPQRISCEARPRSEEHTSELQSQSNLVCRLLLEKKK